jgi:hypothetical protein
MVRALNKIRSFFFVLAFAIFVDPADCDKALAATEHKVKFPQWGKSDEG